jgi:hypothetical protein
LLFDEIKQTKLKEPTYYRERRAKISAAIMDI